MSDWQDDINRHAAELVRLTRAAADASEPLAEDELATLGILIATERQMLIDAVGGLLRENEPEAAAQPGVAEFDAGFCYGLEFGRVIDQAKLEIERARRGRVLKLVHRRGRG
jgi:hypothetical protein